MTPTAVTAAPLAQRPAFVVTWLPNYFSASAVRTAPQFVPWSTPSGATRDTTAEAFIFTGTASRPEARLAVNAINAAAFPREYWPDFATSGSYKHFRLGQVQAAVRVTGLSSYVVATSRGYILQCTGTDMPVADVERVLADLTWR